MDPEMQELLKKHANEKNTSVSKIIRDLVEKHLTKDTDVIPVILKIPVELKGNEEGLNQWLDVKIAAIVKALAS